VSRRGISLADVVPPRLPLIEHSAIGLGLDVATTEKQTSNPSALAVVERTGREYFARLILRWKTTDPAVTEAILTTLLMRLAPRRARRLCIDATSERFFAAALKRKLGALVPVELIVSSEALEYLGESMTYKVFLGNLLVNAVEDGRMLLPGGDWLRDDLRLVKRDRGTFATEVAADGSHGDCFDALKLAIYALEGAGGPAEAAAAGVGTQGAQSAHGRWKNPLAYLHRRPETRNV
jgi:hypothetical protein